MGVKTIKGVNEEDWNYFKSIAAKNNMKMGKLFSSLVHSYKMRKKNLWGKILKTEKIFSDKEANDMLKVVKELRDEYGFR